MKAFCVKCGLFESIQELQGVAELYRVLDGYLSDYLKNRTQIKPDGHCLPRVVFNGLKIKDFLPNHYNYKELFRDAILTINTMIYTVLFYLFIYLFIYLFMLYFLLT